MQDPNEDTEWNDVLRAKGIIPAKAKEAGITEEQIVDIVERTVQEKLNKDHLAEKTLDELDELEDDEDERVLAEYRRKRIAEMRSLQERAKFGSVIEITAVDYVKEINQAGPDTWVVLHLYKQGIPLCALINQYMSQLSVKFAAVKFVKSVASTCVPNYPDRNLPTLFIYYENELKQQIIGPLAFGGMGLKCDDLEWRLHKLGVLVSTLDHKEAEKSAAAALLNECEDRMVKSIRESILTTSGRRNDDDDDDDDN